MPNCLAIIFSLFFSMEVFSKNLGHRLGSDYHKHLPENSLTVLEASIYGINGKAPIMNDEEFSYFEFDLQETLDNQLVIFHDSDFKRMAPNTGLNATAYKSIIHNVYLRTGKKYRYKKLKVKMLTLSEIKSLFLNARPEYKIPTLKEVLDFAVINKVTKPMVIEIKKLHSDKGRAQLIELARKYKSEYGDHAAIEFTPDYDYSKRLSITFLAFKKAVKYSFPSSTELRGFCSKISEYGLGGIYRARRHKYEFCSRL